MRVLLMCPNTKLPVYTGIDVTSQLAFETARFVNCYVACPHCGKLHHVIKKRTFLEYRSSDNRHSA